MSMLIDTHCHIDDKSFDEDRDQILQHCQDLGIQLIIVPAVTANKWDTLLEICNRSGMLLPALGLHPLFIQQHQQKDIKSLDFYIEKYNIGIIGEIGLDFYDKSANKDLQIYFFEAQLEIAKQHKLPVILHVRKAHDQVLQLLKKYSIHAGVAHAFNGSLDQAKQYIDLGFKLGFGGTMTYENSRKIHTLARELPLEAIVLETDSPDMVVSQHRGERNSPEYLHYCLAALAEIRQDSLEHITHQTADNTNEVFNLSLEH